MLTEPVSYQSQLEVSPQAETLAAAFLTTKRCLLSIERKREKIKQDLPANSSSSYSYFHKEFL